MPIIEPSVYDEMSTSTSGLKSPSKRSTASVEKADTSAVASCTGLSLSLPSALAVAVAGAAAAAAPGLARA